MSSRRSMHCSSKETASNSLHASEFHHRPKCRAARALNRERGGDGKVFAQRYHAVQITTARQARNSLAYVLNNWRRHKQDFDGRRFSKFPYNPYSSWMSFDGWSKNYRVKLPAEWKPLPVSQPATRLLLVEYKRFGLIDPYECPGS